MRREKFSYKIHISGMGGGVENIIEGREGITFQRSTTNVVGEEWTNQEGQDGGLDGHQRNLRLLISFYRAFVYVVKSVNTGKFVSLIIKP